MAVEGDRVKRDSFDAMWSFLMLGGQKTNIPTLKEHYEILQRALLQKTAGQRKNLPHDVDWKELDAVINVIVIEAMALYLSGDLDRLEGAHEMQA